MRTIGDDKTKIKPKKKKKKLYVTPLKAMMPLKKEYSKCPLRNAFKTRYSVQLVSVFKSKRKEIALSLEC